MKKTMILLISVIISITSFCLGDHSVSENDLVHIYIDCDLCDLDYLRRNVTFVNYVRDRGDADVHIVELFRPTASGGEEFTFTFYGKKNFEGINDTLKYILQEMDSDETDRNELVRILKLGLIQYVNSTSVADNINIQYVSPTKPTVVVDDPWDSWVFRIGLNGNANGQQSFQSSNSWASLSVERITEDWKFQSSVHGSFGDFYGDYYYGETYYEDIYNKSVSGSVWSLLVKSMGEHLSIGGYAFINSSTYSNTKISYLSGPAIEYSIFPYSESSTHELTLQYKVGASYFEYNDITIYGKIEESLSGEALSLESQFVQPWGTTFIQIEAQHYFHDITKNKFSIYANLSLNLFRGFSLDLSGKYSWINDQISLSQKVVDGDIEPQEYILKQKQIPTNFNYFINIGLSYSFGSIYNNVVNTRF